MNLALHVVGRRDDGYHELESLVVFADKICDRLVTNPAKADALVVEGPFSPGVPTDRRNIVLEALDLAREEAERVDRAIPPLSITLTKNLPHSAGIGGGSADAAAFLRHCASVLPEISDSLRSRSAELGADVPMCLAARPAVARGIGDRLDWVSIEPLPTIVLVNPKRFVSTPAVFKALAFREHPPLPPFRSDGFASFRALLDWLNGTRNDLETTAISLEPAIGNAIAALQTADAPFVRMSGSGATVFGLFPDRQAGERAARLVAERHPNWWVTVS